MIEYRWVTLWLNDAYANEHVVFKGGGLNKRNKRIHTPSFCTSELRARKSLGREQFTLLDPTLFILVHYFDSRNDPSARLSGIQGSIPPITAAIHLWRRCIPLLPYPPIVPLQYPNLIDKIMDISIQYGVTVQIPTSKSSSS